MNFQDYIRYDAVGLAELIRKKEVEQIKVRHNHNLLIKNNLTDQY